MLGRRLVPLLLGLVLTGAAAAQDTPAPTPILTVDQERLFNQSDYGQALLDRIDERTAALAAENRRIEAELMAEERALTDERPTLDPDEFREKAADFDTRVVAIREAQDSKARALVRERDSARQNFFQQILPILTEIVRENGAVVVLESRAVILSADQIDITEEAIARIDARLSLPDAPATDGAGGDQSAPDPDPSQPQAEGDN